MAEIVLAAIVDEYKVGDRFNNWPLHITVLPPFKAENVNQTIEFFQPVINSTNYIFTQLGDYAIFGKDLVVRKVVPNPELNSLHNKLLDVAIQSGIDVTGRYIGKHYTPHITRKSGRDYDGNELTISKVAVVENIGQGYKKIVQDLELKNG